MKRIFIVAAIALLAGCSTFHLGSYCAYGTDCDIKTPK